jgi:hypothetical protein
MKDYLTNKCAGSGIRKKFIPDPRDEKAPDPQHWLEGKEPGPEPQ